MDTVLKDNLREELERSNLQERMALEVLEKSPKGYLIKKKLTIKHTIIFNGEKTIR